MAIKKHTTLLIIAAAAVLNLQFRCNKRFDCAETLYSFELGIKAYPDKDSISVGDTIWLEVNEPTTLKDTRTGAMVGYSGAVNLGSAIGVIELLGNSTSKDCADDFKYVLVKGSEVNNPNPYLIREYQFKEFNSAYTFKLGIVPQKSGIYRISVSEATNVYRQKDKCTKASFRIDFIETNQHLYYNEQNYGVVVQLPNNGYCFKVK